MGAGSEAGGRAGGAAERRDDRALSLGPGLRCLVAENPGPLTLDGTRTYVVGSRRVVVIDPGPAVEGRGARLKGELGGVEVEAVCLTHAHPDHAGCAAEVAARLGAPLAAGEATLARIGAEGRVLTDGDDVPVDGGDSRIRGLATPGHSGDHFSYLWLPGRELFTGDLVLGAGSSLVAHPDGSVRSYLASLARLIALRPGRILPGHGPPVEDPVARLAEYRRHRLERAAQVLEAVRAGAREVDAIRVRVYGELPEGLEGPAGLSILAHLRHLEETGHELPDVLRAQARADRAEAEPGAGAGRGW